MGSDQDKRNGILRLDDGTTWPDPNAQDNLDAEWRARYGVPTRADLLRLASIAAAYHHLVLHPTGTTRTLQKLRMLRRAADRRSKERE